MEERPSSQPCPLASYPQRGSGSCDRELENNETVSACSAGDPGSIPGSGRSLGEGVGKPPQYSWASLVAQPVKKLLAMWETWVPALGWEDLLEKGTATRLQYSGLHSPRVHKESVMTERLSLSLLHVAACVWFS